MRASSPAPLRASGSPGLVQNCPAPIVSEAMSDRPISCPRGQRVRHQQDGVDAAHFREDRDGLGPPGADLDARVGGRSPSRRARSAPPRGRGSGSPLPPESRRASRGPSRDRDRTRPRQGRSPLHLGPASAPEGGLDLIARCRIDGPERGLATADRSTTDQHLPGDGHDLSPLDQPSMNELSAPRCAARSDSPDHLAHRSTSGSSLRAISRRPARVAGWRGRTGWRVVSERMTPPSCISTLAAIRPHCRFS
jgi:hypothetical protein